MIMTLGCTSSHSPKDF